VRIFKTAAFVLVGFVIAGGIGVFALVGISEISTEWARKGPETVQVAALQGRSGDELVALGRQLGLNVTFIDSDSGRDQASREPFNSSAGRTNGNAHIEDGSGTLLFWGGFVFYRWFCETELEHGRLKPHTRPQVYFLD
jgi:hypothetical protein